jgi:hypothetical protein
VLYAEVRLALSGHIRDPRPSTRDSGPGTGTRDPYHVTLAG